MAHQPIAMRRVESPTYLAEHGERGDFAWHVKDEERHLVIALPTANGGWVLSYWPIHPAATDKGHSWKWDGDEDTPTLTPSLHAIGVWHGFVRAGQLIEV